MTNGTQQNLNLKGTISEAFQIGTGGPTIYVGTIAPSNGSPYVPGDVYIQYGTSQAQFQYDGTGWSGAEGTGSVTNVATGTGLTGGPITNAGTISMSTSGVTAGTYGNGTSIPQIVVDALGRITLAVTETALGSMATQNSNNVTITGGTISVTADPINSLDVATKHYVDNTAASLNIHQPVAATTTANLTSTYTPGSAGADGGSGVGATLTNSGSQIAFATDGYSGTTGDRILVKDQSTQLQNGIYTITTVGAAGTNWVLTRASDYDNHAIATDVDQGDFIIVDNGGTYAHTAFVQTHANPIIVGTTAIQFTQFSGAIPVISLTGDVTGSGAGSIPTTLANTAVTAGTYGDGSTYPSFTVDSKGRLTQAGTFAISPTGVTNVATGTGLTGGPITSTGTISMATSGVTAGTYGNGSNIPQITVDALGRVLSASNISVSTGTGTVTSVATGTGLTGGPVTNTGTISMATSGVTAGAYNFASVTVDALGRITTASTGTPVTSIATGTGLTGGIITSTGTISMATSGVTAGSYTTANITVDALGRVTQASNGSAGASLTGFTTASNVGLGSSAGTLISSGADNVVIGVGAGRGFTTASFNTAIGYLSMSATLSGSTVSNNTAVGYSTMTGLTSGSNNTSVGYSAGQSITSGVGITAIGYKALFNNTSGTNTAVGNNAGLNITTGSQNTAIGYNAMPGTVSGATFAQNTAVGDSALNAITTGGTNTAIGYQAGANLTSGSGNIYIGAGATGNSTDANQLNIGGVLQGTMVGTSGLAITTAIQGVPFALGTVSTTTETINFGTACNFSITLGTNITFANPTIMPPGQSGNIAITQAASGGPFTIAFGTVWKSINGTAGTMSVTAGAQNILSYYISDSSHIWYSLQNGGVI